MPYLQHFMKKLRYEFLEFFSIPAAEFCLHIQLHAIQNLRPSGSERRQLCKLIKELQIKLGEEFQSMH